MFGGTILKDLKARVDMCFAFIVTQQIRQNKETDLRMSMLHTSLKDSLYFIGKWLLLKIFDIINADTVYIRGKDPAEEMMHFIIIIILQGSLQKIKIW